MSRLNHAFSLRLTGDFPHIYSVWDEGRKRPLRSFKKKKFAEKNDAHYVEALAFFHKVEVRT